MKNPRYLQKAIVAGIIGFSVAGVGISNWYTHRVRTQIENVLATNNMKGVCIFSHNKIPSLILGKDSSLSELLQIRKALAKGNENIECYSSPHKSPDTGAILPNGKITKTFKL